MKAKLILILTLILMNLQTFSQATNPYVPKILLPSPSAASLMKFTDVPVSTYNGTADVSIPFTSIDLKDISVPVSISYHTGGVRVKDEAGLVGLGWALNAGGMISREIRDLDDFGGEYFNAPVPEITANITPQPPVGRLPANFGATGYIFFCDYLLHTDQGNVDFSTALQGATTIWDMEPDIFSYNFPGHSGKFMISRTGKVVMQKQENLNIQFALGGASFSITDDQGNIFYFADKELAQSANYVGQRTTCWLLSRITTQSGEQINFTYQTDNSWSFIPADIMESYRFGCSGHIGSFLTQPAANQYLNITLQNIDFPKGQLQFIFDGNREDFQNGKKLNALKIYSKATGTNALTYLKEYDLSYSYFYTGFTPVMEYERLRLDSVKELSGGLSLPPYKFTYNTTASAFAVQKHGFSVDHWGFCNGQGNSSFIPTFSSIVQGNYVSYQSANREVNPQYSNCFSLNQIFYPTGGHTNLEYEPNYYDQVASTTGPQDFQNFQLVDSQRQITMGTRGTLTGSVNLSNLYPITFSSTNASLNVTFRVPNTFSVTTRNTCDKIYFIFNGVKYDVCFTNLSCFSNVCTIQQDLTIGIAQSYNYTAYIDPSVPDTSFQDITAVIRWQEIKNNGNPHLPLVGGGLRIKSITDYSSSSLVAKKKKYVYDNENPTTLNTYGRLMSFPSYARLEPLYYVTPPPGGNSNLFYSDNSTFCNSLTFTSSSNSSISSVINGNIVGYDTVKEYIVDPSGGGDIGKTVYAYFNSPDTALYFNGFRMPGVSNVGNNQNGSLLSKITYKNSNSTYVPISETDNFYHATNRIAYYSGKYNLLTNPTGVSNDCTSGNCNSNEYQADFSPSVKSERVLIDSTFETTYDQLDPTRSIVVKKYFSYDNPKHFQITRTKQKDSKGNTIVNHVNYPQDYPSGNTIIDSMIKRNMVSELVEKSDSLYFNTASTGYVMSAQLNTFKILANGSIKKDKSFLLSLPSPVSNFMPFAVNNNITSQDSRYLQMISFDSYDSLANILQYTSTDQVPTSFLWDYLKEYPIAQVKNAINSDIAYTSFEAEGSGNWTFPSAGISTADESRYWNIPSGGTSTAQVTVNVNAAASYSNIFTTQTPVAVTDNDHKATVGQEVGVKFTSSVAGIVTGVRFYKTTANSGTHIGELYSSTGTRLAQATFTSETPIGWQSVTFSSPVAITAGTTYVAAYFSSLGNYVEDNDYFLHNSVSNSPLTAQADGTNGASGTDPGTGQGTYVYTAAPAFPNQLYRSANYWVDVIFTGNSTPVANAGNNQQITLPTSSVTLNGSASSGTLTSYAWTKLSGPNAPTITTPTNVSSTVTSLIQGIYVFQLSVNAGASNSQVTVTVNASGTPTNIFTTQTPVAVTSNDYPGNTNIQGVEDGVKFSCTAAGYITGIRFYKTSGNSGTHIGELYSSAGARLAQATFTGETASGWQTVTFSSPVAITANTTYIAAYFSSLGYYVEDNDYFLGHTVVNSPLTAPSDGTNGASGTDPGSGQGLYKYTASAAFPNQLYRSANYWVDVLYSGNSSSTVASAGSSQSITQPTSSVTLDGSASSGTNATYYWTKVSGPNNPVITTPNNPITTVTGMVQGSYTFQLAVNSASSSAFALTGSRLYNLSGNTITKTGLTSGKKYILSYWSRGGTYAVTGATSTSTTGRSVNGWTYYEHVLTMTSTSINLTGSSYIDELRLYPQGSQMTSLTYQPLVGTVTSNDPNSEISYYEYDSLERLRNVRDYQGNIINNFQYNYAKACTSCAVSMQNFANNATISYPVGVFSVNNQLIGNATTPAQYISLWNTNAANQTIGTLVTGSDSMHFILTVNTGQVSPGYVTGCRYYQFDLNYTNIDAVRRDNGVYVDYGDGRGMFLGRDDHDSSVFRASNTVLNVQHSSWRIPPDFMYWIHNYPDSSLKTLTFYHNDAMEGISFDNALSPALSFAHLSNFRGNLPQFTTSIGGSSFQQSSALTVANITNWNNINSIAGFTMWTGDQMTSSLHLNYAQDFMANNRNLSSISTTRGYYLEGYEDPTFKLTRLKTNWNTYFTNLTSIIICDDHWNREDLSSLKHLNFFQIFSGNVNHSFNQTNNPLVPIPTAAIDNMITQIANGAGSNISNGNIYIYSGGPNRSSSSDGGLVKLKSKGWNVSINGIAQ